MRTAGKERLITRETICYSNCKNTNLIAHTHELLYSSTVKNTLFWGGGAAVPFNRMNECGCSTLAWRWRAKSRAQQTGSSSFFSNCGKKKKVNLKSNKRKWQSDRHCRCQSWTAILTFQSHSPELRKQTTVLTNIITHSTDLESICQRAKNSGKNLCRTHFFVLNRQLSAAQY